MYERGKRIRVCFGGLYMTMIEGRIVAVSYSALFLLHVFKVFD
jgi:hypothetical protein